MPLRGTDTETALHAVVSGIPYQKSSLSPKSAQKMVKRGAKKTVKQPAPPPVDHVGPSVIYQEVERVAAAVTATTDVEIERLLTSLRLLRSYFTEEQLRTPTAQFFKENLPNVSIQRKCENGAFEVRWKDANGSFCDGAGLNRSLWRGLSSNYPECSLHGFEFSSGMESMLDGDDMKMTDLVLEGLPDSQMVGMQDGLRTPGVNNQRLSIGMTPKTLRLPKPGEMILSVRGSPLGVYKDENMEAIHESDEG